MPIPRNQNDIYKADEMWTNEEISELWKSEIFDFSNGLGENRLCSRLDGVDVQEPFAQSVSALRLRISLGRGEVLNITVCVNLCTRLKPLLFYSCVTVQSVVE